MSAPIFEGITPLISDRFIITMTAGEDLAVGVVVELTAAWTVKKPTVINSTKFVGITLTKAVNGGKVSIVCRGICRATASAAGAIAVGDQLTNSGATPGTVVTDNTSKNSTIIGIAVEAIAANATGVILLW